MYAICIFEHFGYIQMQLIIDVGNTRVKVAAFRGSRLEQKEIIDLKYFTKELGDFAGQYPIKKAIISSVGRLTDAQRRSVELRFPTTLLSHNTSLPFNNLYTTPETLGVDRMGLMAAFAKTYPEKPGLVIDAGSCLTYDYIDAHGDYHGGAIAPGIRLRYEAMHAYTAHLPLLGKQEAHKLIGDSTATAMHSGVINGIINEIDGTINRYKEDYKVEVIVVTGGDGEFLSKRLKNSIFAHSNFLLEGLNYILTQTDD